MSTSLYGGGRFRGEPATPLEPVGVGMIVQKAQVGKNPPPKLTGGGRAPSIWGTNPAEDFMMKDPLPS